MSLKRAELKRGVSLSEYTTIRIGGEARYFFSPQNFDDLQKIVRKTHSFYLLGEGSNLLIEDKLISKPIIKLGDSFRYIKRRGYLIEAGAAAPLAYLLSFCLKSNLAGLENLAGIPASVGGAVVMNASSFGRAISHCLEEIEVMDRKGDACRLSKEKVIVGYRSSSLRGYVVLRAWFRLYEDNDLKRKLDRFFQIKQSSQDLNYPSCGCIFKNPPSQTAGFLIDACRLKGLRENGASISLKHANFIINLGGARYKDVDYLIAIVKERVQRRFHIMLEEEIERWH